MSGTTATIRVGRRAFTIVELLIAIGILALVSVGLSVIFGSIGNAVSEGRRAGAIDGETQRIENQIRADLDRLTRDGYMVITQRYASDDAGVVINNARLSIRDRDGAHRTDELMFFARGDFAGMHPPLVSGVQATSNEAAVYYGVGQKHPVDLSNINTPNNYFFNPFPTDSNLRSTLQSPRYNALPGFRAPAGTTAPNPNEYARDWTLLRQVTLLANPKAAAPMPAEVYGIDRQQQIMAGSRPVAGRAAQIALQPTARSIFNSLGWTDLGAYANPAGTPSDDENSRWWIGNVASFPGRFAPPVLRALPAWRASGVVNVAHGTIASIRTQATALAALATETTDYMSPGAINNPFNPRPPNPPATADAFTADWLDTDVNTIGHEDVRGLTLRTQSRFLRAWALDSLPSLWDTRDMDNPRFLAGVRYEDGPTRLVFEGDEFPDNDAGRLGRAIAEGNQEMLGAQIFVPRITEFIVEWTYGKVDDTLAINDPAYKQMRWFGLPRATRDTNGDGVLDFTDHADDPIIERYPRVPNADPTITAERIMATGLNNSNLFAPEFAVFGFTDPNGTHSNLGDDVVIPWPKFIRITMSLADPEDLTTERTFQFVFQVPGERG